MRPAALPTTRPAAWPSAAVTDALPRVVLPETLDALAPDDPAAQRSRRDLRRIHVAMGTRATLRRALRGMAPPRPGRAPRVLELGAGDGRLLLGVAGAPGLGWQGAELTLLDRQPVVAAATVDAYARAGWRATPLVADALDWALAPGEGPAAAGRDGRGRRRGGGRRPGRAPGPRSSPVSSCTTSRARRSARCSRRRRRAATASWPSSRGAAGSRSSAAGSSAPSAPAG